MATKVFVGLLETFGDVVLGSTLARNIKLRFPDAEITFVTDASYVNILQNNPDIMRVWPGEAKNMWDLYTKTCYDRFHKIYLPLMTNHEDTMWHHRPELYYYTHLVDFYAKRCEGLTLLDRRTFVYPNPADQEKALEELAKFPQTKQELVPVSIHVSSPVGSKSWGLANFTKLTKALEQQGCVVYQMGGGGDEKVQTPNIVDLRGKFTARQTAAAIAQSLLYVGIDSGPAYLADSMKVPSIILYGATTHIQAGPLSPLSLPLEPRRRQEFPCGPGPMTCSTHCQISEGPCILKNEAEEVIPLVLHNLSRIVKARYEQIQSLKAEKEKEAVPA